MQSWTNTVQALFSHQDDLASWWEHAQTSTLVDTGIKIPGTTTSQRASSVQLLTSELTILPSSA